MDVSTDKTRCQLAGHHSLPHLPGRQYWASLLWAHVYKALTSLSSRSILLTLNAQRLEIGSEAGLTDSQEMHKNTEDQTIHVTPSFPEIVRQNPLAMLLAGTGVAAVGISLADGVLEEGRAAARDTTTAVASEACGRIYDPRFTNNCISFKWCKYWDSCYYMYTVFQL